MFGVWSPAFRRFPPQLEFKLKLVRAHKSSCGKLADVSFACKAPEGWRTPRRFAYFRNHCDAHSVLECGGPPPLFPELYQTVPMLTGTATKRELQRVAADQVRKA